MYDTKNGVIGGMSLESPFSKKPNGPLPRLQNWSDLTFVLWKHKCAQNNAEVNSIKTIVIVIVANKPSASVIGELIPDLSKLGEKAGTGKTFTPDANGDEFNALMGIPFGQGVGYFLAQHKTSFPGKTVKSVEVIKSGKNPSLIYNLG